jgi:hypothetical protein
VLAEDRLALEVRCVSLGVAGVLNQRLTISRVELLLLVGIHSHGIELSIILELVTALLALRL